MPTKRTPLRRRVRGELNGDQEMCLWLGVGRNGSFPFESEDEAEALWGRHRARLMEAHARSGHRPAAWWIYEAEALGLTYPGYDCEQSYLFDHGQLGTEEAAALVAYWREQFERANEPGFGYCSGPGRWLRGREAREAHIAWADIPRSLVEKWTAERRAERRGA